MSIWGNSSKGLDPINVKTRELWEIWQDTGEIDPEDLKFYDAYPGIEENFNHKFTDNEDDFLNNTEFGRFTNALNKHMRDKWNIKIAEEKKAAERAELDAVLKAEKEEKEAREADRRYRATADYVSTPHELFFSFSKEEMEKYKEMLKDNRSFKDALTYFLIKNHGKKIVKRNYNRVNTVRLCALDVNICRVHPSLLQEEIIKDFCKLNLIEYDDVLSLAVDEYLQDNPQMSPDRYTYIKEA